MHEDMVSAALLKCIKNIKNYKKEYADKSFNYFTRCVEHSFWETLSRHYRQANMVRQLTLDYADKVEQTNPDWAEQIRQS